MERSLALLREGTRQLTVAYANLADAPAAEGGTQRRRQQSAWALDKFPIQIDEAAAQAFRICMTTGSDAFRHALLSIKAEIAIAQNCLRQAAIATGRDSTGDVKELLANAKRSHESIITIGRLM